ncbi:hypothetical protein Y032_0020g115 [Ancylostoma ceylanicum]|uniref:GSKIP domain-containing protein n=1 Tax=Ancylostoma ceylanicum TaxID=53326 RepID=A0A016V0U1_9BILA|nr:hypothetical protein Y032_0020g115 [Ancylostoma ceylanicum]
MKSRIRSTSLLIDNGRMIKTEPIPCLRCGNIGSPSGSLPLSLHKVSSINRSFAGTNPGSRGDSSLELEAIAAVHELSFAVQSISVSEMLPRTPDLIFVNLTTIEDQPFCLELTHKGWRITSLRLDCMVGDFTRLELFTKYYDSLFSLMDDISPGYRARFGEKLALKLKMLEAGEESGIAPCGSYASSSHSRGSSRSRSDSSSASDDSLPERTPRSSPVAAAAPRLNNPLFG